MLTRLNAIDGIVSSSARLGDDGSRMVQIKVRPGTNVTQVVEKVRSALRAEVRSDAPAQLDRKAAEAVEAKQDWLTLGELNTIAAREEGSSQRFETASWLLALTVLLALGAFFLWLWRRRGSVRQRSEVRLGSPNHRLPPCERFRATG